MKPLHLFWIIVIVLMLFGCCSERPAVSFRSNAVLRERQIHLILRCPFGEHEWVGNRVCIWCAHEKHLEGQPK